MRKIAVEVPEKKCWEERVYWDATDKKCPLLYKVRYTEYTCPYRAYVSGESAYRLKPTKACREAEVKS